jgi:hypothetical protein
MPMFLVFMRNTTSRADFVAAYNSASLENAQEMAKQAYPSPAFSVLTTFAQTEIERIVADLKRWPGVPSNVVAAKITSHVGQGLPPLPTLKQAVQAVGVQPTGAMVQQIKPTPATQTSTSNAQAGLTLADAMAALRGKNIVPMQNKPATAPVSTPPASARGKAVDEPVVSASPVQAANAGRSVIDVLRTLRG